MSSMKRSRAFLLAGVLDQGSSSRSVWFFISTQFSGWLFKTGIERRVDAFQHLGQQIAAGGALVGGAVERIEGDVGAAHSGLDELFRDECLPAHFARAGCRSWRCRSPRCRGIAAISAQKSATPGRVSGSPPVTRTFLMPSRCRHAPRGAFRRKLSTSSFGNQACSSSGMQ
jgi:hypothetical protein